MNCSKYFLMALLLSAPAYAETILITDGLVHTGDGSAAERRDILISDGTIQRVAADLQADADTVIEANGRPVTPALFAGITASGLSEIGMVYESVDSGLNELYTGLMHPEFDVRDAYNPHASVIPVTRVEGYGYSLLSATTRDRTLAGQGSLVRLDGGFTSFEGDTVLYVNVDGDSGNKLGGSRAAHWMLLQNAFDELATTDADLTLISAAGKATLKSARKNSLFVFQANRASDLLRVIRFAQAHKLRAVISGGQQAWMVREALSDASIPVVLNAMDNLPGNFDALGARLDNAALLHEAGVTVLFTSGETHNARKVRQVAGVAVANGLPHAVAIKAMTSLPAAVFGGAERALVPGARADVVVWSGDPLDVNAAADQVIIGGQLDSMQSRQTQLLQRYLPVDAGMGRAYINP